MKLLDIISAIVIVLFSIFYIISYLVVINTPSFATYSALFFVSLFFTPVIYAVSENSINIRNVISAKKEIQTYWLSIVALFIIASIIPLIPKDYEAVGAISLSILLLFITWGLLPSIASTNEKSYDYYIRSGYSAIAFMVMAIVVGGGSSSLGDMALYIVFAFFQAFFIGLFLFPPLLKFVKNLISSGTVGINKEALGELFGVLVGVYLVVMLFVIMVSKLELYVVDLLTPTGVVIIGSLIAVAIGYQTMNLIGRLFATIFTTNEKTIKIISNSIIVLLIVVSVFFKVTNFDKNLEILNKTQEKVSSLVEKIERKN